ncbi:hypothetical protein [Marivirga harenae]|uniref:hypothetical protein n=1 Tax=Marivirga harenae TaxID=2010992 RepID=UPI0026E1097E|nr:hypothetical protein [Marivirga harenae]WKV10623.1 hypothetical protein Q3Y49_10390 [Marivirga harenae]|tara:strand:- start:597062 stop:597664 length:603 start_codon:yes stop_codon:yes gene_type:complete
MKKYSVIFITMALLYACNTAPKEEKESITAQKPSLEDYHIGEQWTWMEKSVAGEKIRWEGQDKREVVAFEGSLGFWNGTDTVLISNTIKEETSNTPFRDWPLEVGKKWTFESKWENAEGTAMITNQEVEVVSYEEVVVLAGRFMAYKIEHKGTFTNTKAGSGKMNDTYWYAPALKTSIKHAQDDGYGSYMFELYDYKSGK